MQPDAEAAALTTSGNDNRLILTGGGNGAVVSPNPADELTPASSATTARSNGRVCAAATARSFVDEHTCNGSATRLAWYVVTGRKGSSMRRGA